METDSNMKKLISLLFVFIMLLFLFPGVLPAIEEEKKGYVLDMLWLSFRDGPGEDYRSLRSLRSDTPVLVLEEQGKYFKVRLNSGEEGWANKRFISFAIPKTQIITELKQTNEELENKIKELEARPSQNQPVQNQPIKEIKADTKGFIKEMEALLKTAMDTASNANLSFSDNKEEYNTLIEQLGNIREIAKENKALHDKTKSLSEKIKSLSDQIESLQSESSEAGGPIFFKADMIKWALFGVGVLLLGWIFGHSISVRRRRRSSSLLD
jgi:SH3 domain protein